MFTDWTALTKEFVKAQCLESIQLPMYSDFGSENVEAVLSALKELPALKTYTLNMNDVR